jgi:sirohydrochlorin ferrochelatase
MKLLTEEKLAALTAKAANWDSMVSHYLEANPEAKEITPDSLLEAFAANQDESEIQSKLDAAQTEVQTLTTAKTKLEGEKTELQTQVDNLLAGSGAKGASVKSESELGATEDDLAEFGKKNSGDTFSILTKAKEEGLI